MPSSLPYELTLVDTWCTDLSGHLDGGGRWEGTLAHAVM